MNVSKDTKLVIPFGVFVSRDSELAAVCDTESVLAPCAGLLNIAFNTLEMSRKEEQSVRCSDSIVSITFHRHKCLNPDFYKL